MNKKEENKVAKGFCLISEEINSLREESERLKALIEKMKCCGNCKHEQDSNTNYYCEDCKRFANETDIDKWELAE